MLVIQCRYFLRKLKDIKAESWIIKPTDATKKFTDHDLSHLNLKSYRDIKL